MRNEDTAVRPGAGVVRGIDESFVPEKGCRGRGIRAEKVPPGNACARWSTYGTNLEKTSVSTNELPGSLRNLFLPPPQEGYGRDKRLSQRRLPGPRPAAPDLSYFFNGGRRLSLPLRFPGCPKTTSCSL